jgi:ribonuclease III
MSTLRRLLTRLRTIVGASPVQTSAEIDFKNLERALKYSIRDHLLFQQALSHRSYIQSTANPAGSSNERLEFLGDSVLNLVVGEYLYRREPLAQEGMLTKNRARLVNRKALSVLADELHLDEFILISPQTTQISSRGMETILSDAFEAVVGALYLDGGFEEAQTFIERCLVAAVERGTLTFTDENFKSQLLEQAQACGLGIPRYVTVKEAGPDHDRTFTVEVFIGSQSYGVGIGKNKKDAEQAAAAHALPRITEQTESE